MVRNPAIQMKTFNRKHFRELYEKVLRPKLVNHRPLIELDDRNEFYLGLLERHSLLEPGKRLVDLGAGLSVFGPICSAHGMRVTLVDDFGGGGGVEVGQKTEEIPLLEVFEKQLGVEVIQLNFLEQPLPLRNESIDVVTCFHSLEHWHHSPKRLFGEIRRVVKPGGYLIIATPNALNIRKRAYVMCGRSSLPSLNDWYNLGDPIYRGHVREPVIRDLHQLLEWNGFEVCGTFGRNFIGRRSKALSGLPLPIVNALAVSSDWVLRFFPSLCSDIHVVGRKV